MNSSSADPEGRIKEFEQILRGMHAEIAYAWYQAILPIGSLLNFREEAIQQFELLTATVIQHLSSTSTLPEEAYTIGIDLAKLNVIDAKVISATGDLWYRLARKVSDPDRNDLPHRVGLMMFHLAAGYFEQSRRSILFDQEQIRKALVTTIERTNNELFLYKTQLENMLETRTEQLAHSEKNFRQITETSLEGIIQVNTAGFILFVNQSFARMIGIPAGEIIGQPLLNLIPEDKLDQTARLIQGVLAGDNVRTELQLIHKDGHVLDLIISATRTDLPNQVVLTLFATDISDRIAAERKLFRSEERYRTLAETAQVLIAVIDREGRIEYINTYAANYHGLKPENMVGKNYFSYFNSRSKGLMSKTLALCFDGNTTESVEQKIDFPRGPVWLRTSLVPLIDKNNEVKSVFTVSTDITEIKNYNKKLLDNKKSLEKAVKQRTASLEASQEQSRKLARQIVSTQENERRRVSRELHDEAGQALISLKYELDSSFNELGLDSIYAKNLLGSMLASIDHTNEQIRELSHSLRPPILDVAGINLSLEDYCLETSERTGLKIDYQGLDLPGLADEIGISLYRILQEALVNILKHANARNVDVKLDYQAPDITLCVTDNGIGMDTKTNGNGMGLLGIRERVKILEGDLNIVSQPGKGTQLIISIPWQVENSK